MGRISIHGHDFLFNILRFIREVDTVTQRFTHLGFAISPGQAEACFIGRKDNFRFHQGFPINFIKLTDNFPCLFQHRFLILPRGNGGCHKAGNISCLAHRIAKEPGQNARFKVFLLDFCFHRRISFKSCHGNQIHIVHSEFRQCRYEGLNENAGLFRIDAYREVIQCHLEYIFTHLFRIICIVCQSLGISNFNVYFIKFSGVLEGHSFTKRPHIMAYKKTARRTVTG